MKRFLVLVSLCFPLSVSAANKMSMVTYFPVPYVAYSRINVSDQLDAGLTSACNMNLGCNESAVNLSVNTLNVKPYSKLDLNGGKGVWSNSMTLGSGSDNGRIAFNKVRIQGGTSRSINVQGTINVPSLKLFESDFPDCKQAGGKDGTMSWKPLKLKGASGNELYLACGETGAASCPTPPAGEPSSRQCPSGSGTQTRTWNTSTCSWNEWQGECVEAQYTCITSYNWHSLSVPGSEPGSGIDNPRGDRWQLKAWEAVMTCDGSDYNGSTPKTSCKPGEECNCTPGTSYLYTQTYGCTGKIGWYCAQCSAVTSKSQCAQSVTNMIGKPCSEEGSGTVGIRPMP